MGEAPRRVVEVVRRVERLAASNPALMVFYPRLRHTRIAYVSWREAASLGLRDPTEAFMTSVGPVDYVFLTPLFDRVASKSAPKAALILLHELAHGVLAHPARARRLEAAGFSPEFLNAYVFDPLADEVVNLSVREAESLYPPPSEALGAKSTDRMLGVLSQVFDYKLIDMIKRWLEGRTDFPLTRYSAERIAFTLMKAQRSAGFLVFQSALEAARAHRAARAGLDASRAASKAERLAEEAADILRAPPRWYAKDGALRRLEDAQKKIRGGEYAEAYRTLEAVLRSLFAAAKTQDRREALSLVPPFERVTPPDIVSSRQPVERLEATGTTLHAADGARPRQMSDAEEIELRASELSLMLTGVRQAGVGLWAAEAARSSRKTYVDWRRILSRYIYASTRVKSRLDWMRPSPTSLMLAEQLGGMVVAPGRGGRDGRVILMIDTSGSITLEELETFLGMAGDALRAVHGLAVVFWSSGVVGARWVRSLSDVDNVEVIRGGTQLAPALAALREGVTAANGPPIRATPGTTIVILSDWVLGDKDAAVAEYRRLRRAGVHVVSLTVHEEPVIGDLKLFVSLPRGGRSRNTFRNAQPFPTG